MVRILYLTGRRGAEAFLVMPTVSNNLLGLFPRHVEPLPARANYQWL
jgi:hypothetical protein